MENQESNLPRSDMPVSESSNGIDMQNSGMQEVSQLFQYTIQE